MSSPGSGPTLQLASGATFQFDHVPTQAEIDQVGANDRALYPDAYRNVPAQPQTGALAASNAKIGTMPQSLGGSGQIAPMNPAGMEISPIDVPSGQGGPKPTQRPSLSLGTGLFGSLRLPQQGAAYPAAQQPQTGGSQRYDPSSIYGLAAGQKTQAQAPYTAFTSVPHADQPYREGPGDTDADAMLQTLTAKNPELASRALSGMSPSVANPGASDLWDSIQATGEMVRKGAIPGLIAVTDKLKGLTGQMAKEGGNDVAAAADWFGQHVLGMPPMADTGAVKGVGEAASYLNPILGVPALAGLVGGAAAQPSTILPTLNELARPLYDPDMSAEQRANGLATIAMLGLGAHGLAPKIADMAAKASPAFAARMAMLDSLRKNAPDVSGMRPNPDETVSASTPATAPIDTVSETPPGIAMASNARSYGAQPTFIRTFVRQAVEDGVPIDVARVHARQALAQAHADAEGALRENARQQYEDWMTRQGRAPEVASALAEQWSIHDYNPDPDTVNAVASSFLEDPRSSEYYRDMLSQEGRIQTGLYSRGGFQTKPLGTAPELLPESAPPQMVADVAERNAQPSPHPTETIPATDTQAVSQIGPEAIPDKSETAVATARQPSVESTETGSGIGQKTQARIPVSDALSEIDRELPGFKTLPDDVRQRAAQAAADAGLTRQRVSLQQWRQMAADVGFDPASFGNEPPELSGLALGAAQQALTFMDREARDADAALASAKSSGASDAEIAKANAAADEASAKFAQVSVGVSKGATEAGRTLRNMATQIETGRTLQDLVNAANSAKNARFGTDLTVQEVQKLRTAHDNLSDALAAETQRQAGSYAERRPASGSFGESNVLTTKDDVRAALAKLAQTTGQIGSGIGPQHMAALLEAAKTIGAYLLEAGKYKFDDWLNELRAHLGPHGDDLTREAARSVYNAAWNKVKAKVMQGSEYGESFQTATAPNAPDSKGRSTFGVESPDVAKARQEIADLLAKYRGPGWGEKIGHFVAASYYMAAHVPTKIASAGIARQIWEETKRLPASLENVVSQGLRFASGRPYKAPNVQGASPRDFLASMGVGFVEGAKNMIPVMREGRNAIQAAIGAENPDFFGRGGESIPELVKTGRGAELVGRAHMAINQPFAFMPGYYRAIYEQASLMADKAVEAGASRADAEQLRKKLIASPTQGMSAYALNRGLEYSNVQDNRLVSFISKGRSNLPQGAHIALGTVMPVVRPPTNIGFEAANSTPIGLARGLYDPIRSAITGSKMTPSEKALSLKLVNQGAIGTLMVWLGAKAYQAQKVNAAYQMPTGPKEYKAARGPGETDKSYSILRRENDYKDVLLKALGYREGDTAGEGVLRTLGLSGETEPGSIRAGGMSVPHEWASIFGSLAVLGANMQRDSDRNLTLPQEAGNALPNLAGMGDPFGPVEGAATAIEKALTPTTTNKPKGKPGIGSFGRLR